MSQEKSASSPQSPLPIHRLHQSLINRIAAGEIIHRPASALKELLENCLDARATSIKITVKDGGMKLLQIQDNGCGIRRSDLPILAERFTTSKISSFSDLSRITTYGFRGEALASISHVARLSVVTKTRSEAHAWKACYLDGVLVPSKPGQTPDPKPCAGVDGTIITIEDMFYNTPIRLSALRSPSEEYARVLDVVTKYAVHNPAISFLCKKAGSPSPEISTSPASDILQAIRSLYGHAIAKELLRVDVTSEQSKDGIDDPERWSAEAYCTNANFQAKKMVFLLFINRAFTVLVESSPLRRAIESVYSGFLPKGTFPFVIEMDPRSVDVNVHPTKREVLFLNEEAIVERISDAIQQNVVGQSQSRVPSSPAVSTNSASLKGKKKAREDGNESESEDSNENDDGPTKSAPLVQKTLSQHKVRTSLQDRTLESMLPVNDPSRSDDSSGRAVRLRDIKESQCSLTSIAELRQSVVKNVHHDLTEIIRNHVFVGIVDNIRCLSLIQHSTKLYLINHATVAEEMFYQLALMQFGNYRRLRLDPHPPLRTLVELAVNIESGTERSGLQKSEIVDRIARTLVDRREMLSEYFALDISESGDVLTLPHLLKEYTPDLNKLPTFLMRLGPQVDWKSERECFESFMRELAYFYSPASGVWSGDGAGQEKSAAWQTEHILFHALRRFFIAPRSLLDNDVVQVANLPDLYRVFERC
ncbi:histidine kinase-like ATPase [Pisolithus orientalis]|uniref:histidine kinase-like ATPase n=1 Tax=Pisolithus orientalis TaxID=936130 RepID=UPI002224FD28|nr:histidine kinase-like ATPase [Pisolithus orientalis]KAI6001571.1 histidine kinase-like ATPase [Pisolithus orientalis]